MFVQRLALIISIGVLSSAAANADIKNVITVSHCNYISKEAKFILNEHQRLEQKKSDIINQSISRGNATLEANENETIDFIIEGQLTFLEQLSKWASAYGAFCK